MPAELGLWVYNSENSFVGSLYHNTCCVKRHNRFLGEEKKHILGHPSGQCMKCSKSVPGCHYKGMVDQILFKPTHFVCPLIKIE